MKKGYIYLGILLLSQILIEGGVEPYCDMGTPSKYLYIARIWSVFADILLVYVLNISFQRTKIEKEMNEIQYLTEIVRNINKLLVKQQRILQCFKLELETEMNHIIQKVEQNKYCDNAIVNAVICDKEKRCMKLGVDLDIDLLIPAQISVEPLHVCSIFSNLLDNAIDAVTEIEQSKRKIELCGAINGSYMCIKVKNPTTKDYAYRKRRKGHGYGSIILLDIARKYNGTYTGNYDNGIYTAAIAVKAV